MNLELKTKFENVLQDGEDVVAIAKAHKLAYIMGYSLISMSAIIILMFVAFFTLMIAATVQSFVVVILGVIAYFVIMIIRFVVGLASYKNYFVCLTKTRVIIRYGAVTTKYTNHAIENVSGNIRVLTEETLFDKKLDGACMVRADIELLPVGHGMASLITKSIEDGYKFIKLVEKQVIENSKSIEND